MEKRREERRRQHNKLKTINIIQKKFARKELCGNVKTRKKSSASWNLLEYSSRAPTTVKRAKTKKSNTNRQSKKMV